MLQKKALRCIVRLKQIDFCQESFVSLKVTLYSLDTEETVLYVKEKVIKYVFTITRTSSLSLSLSLSCISHSCYAFLLF
jgi:hypothetical protein